MWEGLEALIIPNRHTLKIATAVFAETGNFPAVDKAYLGKPKLRHSS
jgi:hypothetical protein